MKAILILGAGAFVALGVIVLPLAASQDDPDATDGVPAEELAEVAASAADVADETDQPDAVVASDIAAADETTATDAAQSIQMRFQGDSQITAERLKDFVRRYPELGVEVSSDAGDQIRMIGRKEAVETLIRLLRRHNHGQHPDAAEVAARADELAATTDSAAAARSAADELLQIAQDRNAQNTTASGGAAMDVNELLKATIAELLAEQRANEARYQQALAAQQRSEAAANAGASAALSRAELLKLARAGFISRQELHRQELQRLKERVEALERRLEQRETLQDRIINQHVDAMLKEPASTDSELAQRVHVVNGLNHLFGSSDPAPGRGEPEYLLRGGDTLGVYIPNVIPPGGEAPPVFVVGETGTPATGYPLTIRGDGTLSLPFIPRVNLAGKTLSQAEDLIRASYAENGVLKTESAIVLISLIRRAGAAGAIRQLSTNGSGNRGETTEGTLGREWAPSASPSDNAPASVSAKQDWPNFGDRTIRLAMDKWKWKDALTLLAEHLNLSLDFQALPDGTLTVSAGDISPTAALDLFEDRLNAVGYGLQATDEILSVVPRQSPGYSVGTVSTPQRVPSQVIVQAATEKSPTQYFDALSEAYRNTQPPTPSGRPVSKSAIQRYELLLREFETQLHLLRSKLELAQAEHAAAEAEFERGRQLQERHLITDNEVRVLQMKVVATQSKVEQAMMIMKLYDSVWDEDEAARELEQENTRPDETSGLNDPASDPTRTEDN